MSSARINKSPQRPAEAHRKPIAIAALLWWDVIATWKLIDEGRCISKGGALIRQLIAGVR